MDLNDTNEDEKEREDNSSSSISSDLIRGHINTIILRTLYDNDKYGYEIINEIEEKSKGQYTLKQPTLYSALKRLESQDYLTSYWGGVSNGGRRKYFQITDKGRQVVEQNLAEWEYSRTVIDSLISERDFDFNNPPPTASVDFNILKKSTSRIPTPKNADENEDAEFEQDFPDQNIQALSDEQSKADASVPTGSNNSFTQTEESELPHTDMQSAETTSNYSSDSRQITPPQERPLSEEEKQRIHENYKVLVGNENDATAYYYSQVAKRNREESNTRSENTVYNAPSPQTDYTGQATYEAATSSNNISQANYYQEQPPVQNFYQQQNPEIADNDTNAYSDENEPVSDYLYANKSPAERNYKSLLSRLYDNTQKNHEEVTTTEQNEYNYYPKDEYKNRQNSTEYFSSKYQSEQQDRQTEQRSSAPQGTPGSNIEFYDMEEKAENEGLKITTTNGARNRTVFKSSANTFDKGKALFLTAVYVFIIALAESIVNICLQEVLNTGTVYVVLPFVIDFVMLGVFLFLYLKGYGKNSRRTQSKSYISASLILFANLVLIVCLIVYLISLANASTLSDMIYAVFPCVYLFNIPLFAIFYNYNCNKS